MRTIAYWLERGTNPEYLFTCNRDELIILAAVAELNQEETKKNLPDKS